MPCSPVMVPPSASAVVMSSSAARQAPVGHVAVRAELGECDAQVGVQVAVVDMRQNRDDHGPPPAIFVDTALLQ